MFSLPWMQRNRALGKECGQRFLRGTAILQVTSVYCGRCFAQEVNSWTGCVSGVVGQSDHYHSLFLFKIYFSAVMGLRCCMQTSFRCRKQGLSFVVVCGLLLLRSKGSRVHGAQELWLMDSCSCGAWA